jgi:hypothetical protein
MGPQDQVKHLELIQGVVNRLARNSFVMKGWAVTLIAAVFALGIKETTPTYFLIAFLPAFVFWALDGYYLRQERLFRKLYDGIRKMDFEEWNEDPFIMDTRPYNDKVVPWICVCFSRTILPIYLSLVLVIIGVVVVSFTAIFQIVVLSK